MEIEEDISIKDYVNLNRLPLPTKKEDLKILFLVNGIRDEIKYISDSTKLNITYIADNNSSSGKNVNKHLGEYDIIIASELYSGNLTCLNNECNEQCKDTGRDLALLVCYEGIEEKVFSGTNNFDLHYETIGSRISLDYKFAGSLAVDTQLQEEKFSILKQSNELSSNYLTPFIGIISSVVNIYSNELEKINKTGISDLDLKTASEFDEEYNIEDEKRKAELFVIYDFDNARRTVLDYLNYRSTRGIYKWPKGLKIYEENDGVRLENVLDDRVLCALTFSKKDKKRDLRIFEVETVSKKGTLSAPQTVGLYIQASIII